MQFLLQVQRTEVLYWKVNTPEFYAAPNFPCLGAYIDNNYIYSLPAMEYPGLFKVCVLVPVMPFACIKTIALSHMHFFGRCVFMKGFQQILMKEIAVLILCLSR